MNIFARELAMLLERHGKELGSLYGLHSLTYQLVPNKVTRLKRSLAEDITATLNAEEIGLLAEWLHLDANGDEIRRLRAALVAESIRHLLGGRMNRDKALKLGEITFQLLLGQESNEFLNLRDELLEGIRGGDPLEENASDPRWETIDVNYQEDESKNDQIEHILEPAVEIYEQGALWLEVARDTSDFGTRLGYLAQAQALLERARDLVADVSSLARGTTQQGAWRSIIELALNEISSLR